MDSGFTSLPFELVQPPSLQDHRERTDSSMTLPSATPQVGFVTTDIFSRVKDQITAPNVHAVVILGATGSGKTTLALETCSELCSLPGVTEEGRTKPLFRQLTCTTLDMLCSDISLLYRDLALDRPAFADTSTWCDVIQTLYNDMNQFYPSDSKIFVFDDTEQMAELLKEINFICKKQDLATDRLTGCWKILVTAQRGVQKPREFSFIKPENFFQLEGFTRREVVELFDDFEDIDVDDIMKRLGSLPLTLRIFRDSLNSNQLDDMSEFISHYLLDIEAEMARRPNVKREDSAIYAIKISIDRLTSELRFKEKSEQVIKLMTFFSEKNLSGELLTACAETVTDNPKEAKLIINQLTSTLLLRSLCKKRAEGKGVVLFSFHQLVKMSMKLFVTDDESLELLRCALTAFTRVMPKDGRKHQTRLVGFYINHAESMDAELLNLHSKINRVDTPLHLLLHCDMLIGLGYCLLAQRNGFKSGVERLQRARDKFCELVLGSGETYETVLQHSRLEEDQRDREKAHRLYTQSMALPIAQEQWVCYTNKYIRELPEYHRLTKKDLKSMKTNRGSGDPSLVNNHLTREDVDQFRHTGIAIEQETLAKLYIAELLAQIFCVWSKVSSKKAEYEAETREECIHQAEAAMKVYGLIYADFGIYLLAALITERETLDLKLNAAQSTADVEGIISSLKELSRIGQVENKRMAFEAGLRRSDLRFDCYHDMVCKQALLLCQGRLFQLSGDDIQYYKSGEALFVEVTRLTDEQLNTHSAYSYTYKVYARFLKYCKRYGGAVLSILRAMQHLHDDLACNGNSSRNGNGNGNGNGLKYPEFNHPRFTSLYSDIVCLYKLYDENRSLGEKLLDEDMAEYKYLHPAIDVWKGIGGGGGTQPTDGNTKFEYLEAIDLNEVRESTKPVQQ